MWQIKTQIAIVNPAKSISTINVKGLNIPLKAHIVRPNFKPPRRKAL